MFRSLQYCKTNYCYIIDSLTEYINILFYAFVSNNPIVSVCNNCDRLFVPKTKKVNFSLRQSNERTYYLQTNRCKEQIPNYQPYSKGKDFADEE